MDESSQTHALLKCTALFWVPAAMIAWLLIDSQPENGIFLGHYLPMARWLQGEGQRGLLTYPIWGYPAVLTLFSPTVVIGLQTLLCALTLAAVWLCLRDVVSDREILRCFVLFAVPWFALCAGLWPMGLAGCLALLALLALQRGIDADRFVFVAVGGALMGLALNFRSEFIVWIGWLGPLLCATRHPLVPRPRRFKYLAGFTAIALLCLLPWALFYRANTGHVSLSSSNGGMVAYLSLGQLPDNPWRIVHDDGFGRTALRARGVDADPLSDVADREFHRALLEAVKTHPTAFTRKILHNVRNVWLGGFYVGELSTSAADQVALDVWREHLKLRLGLNPNHTEITAYKASGVWDSAVLSTRGVGALLWQLTGVLFGVGYLALMAIGLVWDRKRWTHEHIALLFFAVIGAQLCLASFLQDQPRHVTILYVVGLPFAVCGASRLLNLRKSLM